MQKQKKNIVKLLSAGLAASMVTAGVLPVFAQEETAENKPVRLVAYLDKEEGSDKNKGTSQTEALKSLKAVREYFQEKEESLPDAEKTEASDIQRVLVLCQDTELTEQEKEELKEYSFPVLSFQEFLKLLEEEWKEQILPSPTPEPTKEPEAEETPTPEPTKEPEAEKTPTPEPTKEPEKEEEPEAEETPTPEPTKEPEKEEEPEAEKTPAPEAAKEPEKKEEKPEAEETPTPEPTKEPEKEEKPEAAAAPRTRQEQPEQETVLTPAAAPVPTEPPAASVPAETAVIQTAALQLRSLPGVDLVGGGSQITVTPVRPVEEEQQPAVNQTTVSDNQTDASNNQTAASDNQTTTSNGSLTHHRPAQAVPTGDVNYMLPYTLSAAVALLGGGVLIRLRLEKRRNLSRALVQKEREQFRKDCKIQ